MQIICPTTHLLWCCCLQLNVQYDHYSNFVFLITSSVLLVQYRALHRPQFTNGETGQLSWAVTSKRAANCLWYEMKQKICDEPILNYLLTILIPLEKSGYYSILIPFFKCTLLALVFVYRDWNHCSSAPALYKLWIYCRTWSMST